jgi:hypothetical protein
VWWFQRAQDHRKRSLDAKVIIVFVLLALPGRNIRPELKYPAPNLDDACKVLSRFRGWPKYPARIVISGQNIWPQIWTTHAKSLAVFRGGQNIRSKLGPEYPALQYSNGYNPGRGINTPLLLQAWVSSFFLLSPSIVDLGKLAHLSILSISDKGLGKTEEKLRSWGKLSTTKDLRARK